MRRVREGDWIGEGKEKTLRCEGHFAAAQAEAVFAERAVSKDNTEALAHVEHVLGVILLGVGGWYLLLAPFKPSEVLWESW